MDELALSTALDRAGIVNPSGFSLRGERGDASLNSWSSSCSRLPQAIKSRKGSSSPVAEDVARTGPPSFASLASVRDSLIFQEPRAPSIA
jgi:hypothetical protein